MSFHLPEITRLLQEGSITMNTRRYSLKLTSVETLDPITLTVPRSYARLDHNCPTDFVDRVLQRKGEDSKVFLLTDGLGHKEVLLIQMDERDEG